MLLKNQIIKILIIILVLFTSCFFVKPVKAQYIFFENFDSYLNDSFPLEWVTDAVSPSFWKVVDQKLIGVNPTNGCYSHILYNATWTNYNLEFNITGTGAIDRFVVFRVDHSRGTGKEEYYFKYTESNYGPPSKVELGKGSSGPLNNCQPNPLYQFSSVTGTSHKFKISLNDNNIKIFEIVNNNHNLIFDCVDNNQPLLYGGIGFFNQPNGASINESTSVEIDSILITPFTSDIVLNVPDIKQYDSRWKDLTYNKANIWAPANPTLEHWGCALTSVSMILHYHNHLINPDELNSWLLNQHDGYLRNGLLNFLAITRYSRINSDSNSPKLEYRRFGNNISQLDLEITSDPSRPAILKLPGHFVIAKGKGINDYYINDPGSTKSKLSDFEGTYLSLNQFKPSNTDLSYIMLTTNENSNLKVYDPNRNQVGSEYFYLDGPIMDNLSKTMANTDTLKVFLLPKPTQGDYLIEISNQNGYFLDSYLYDIDGNFTTAQNSGSTQSDNFDIYKIIFGENNSIESKKSSGEKVAGTSTTSSTSSGCSDKKPGSVPTLVSVVSSGPNEVTLIWLKAKDPVTYYLLTFGTKPGEMLYGNSFVGGRDTTSYTVKGLSAGTRYYFRVRAGNNCMPGDFSNELSAVVYGEVLNEIPEGFSPGVLGEETTTIEKVLGKETVSPTPEISPIPQADRSRRNIIFAGIGIILLAIGYYFFLRRKREL